MFGSHVVILLSSRLAEYDVSCRQIQMDSKPWIGYWQEGPYERVSESEVSNSQTLAQQSLVVIVIISFEAPP